MGPDPATRLCRLSDIPDPGSVAVSARVAGQDRAMMVIRRGETIRAYVNACPHVGTPLDFVAGRFLNIDKTHIICATHGALFQVEDGLCVSGPCVHKYLESITIIADFEADEIRLKAE